MLVALIGPHAVGKSSAGERWAERYKDINVVNCDNAVAYNSSGWRERQRGWLGSTDEKVALATLCADEPKLWVCEGNTARNMPWLKVVPIYTIIHTYCKPKLFGTLMKERCNRNGKKYREDYWTEQKLWYESEQRFRNAWSKHLNPRTTLKDFLIEDVQKDWKKVDMEFSKVYHEIKKTVGAFT